MIVAVFGVLHRLNSSEHIHTCIAIKERYIKTDEPIPQIQVK